MNQINAVTIGKLISAHREGDEEKFKAYVEFIADAYEQQGDNRAANIIRSNYTGGYGEHGKVILDEAAINSSNCEGVYILSSKRYPVNTNPSYILEIASI